MPVTNYAEKAAGTPSQILFFLHDMIFGVVYGKIVRSRGKTASYVRIEI
jgi:hypothetical protein